VTTHIAKKIQNDVRATMIADVDASASDDH